MSDPSYVINPDTGRQIKVGGVVYQALVASGRIVPDVGSTSKDHPTSQKAKLTVKSAKPTRVANTALPSYAQLIKKENPSLYQQIAPHVAQLPDLRPPSPTKKMTKSAPSDDLNLRWSWIYDELSALSRQDAAIDVKIMDVINDDDEKAAYDLVQSFGDDMSPLRSFFATYRALMHILRATNRVVLMLATAGGAIDLVTSWVDLSPSTINTKAKDPKVVIPPLLRFLRDFDTASALWKFWGVPLNQLYSMGDIITWLDAHSIPINVGREVFSSILVKFITQKENYGLAYWAILSDYGDIHAPTPSKKPLITDRIFADPEELAKYINVLPVILQSRLFDPGMQHNVLIHNLLDKEYEIDKEERFNALKYVLSVKDERIDPGDQNNQFLKNAREYPLDEDVRIFELLISDPRVNVNANRSLLLYDVIKGPPRFLKALLKHPDINPGENSRRLFEALADYHSYYIEKNLPLILEDRRADPTIDGVLDLFIFKNEADAIFRDPRVRESTINIKNFDEAWRYIEELVKMPNLTLETVRGLFIAYSKHQRVIKEVYEAILNHPLLDPAFDRSAIFTYQIEGPRYADDRRRTMASPLTLLLQDGRADPSERSGEIDRNLLFGHNTSVLEGYLADGRFDPTFNNCELFYSLVEAYRSTSDQNGSRRSMIELLLGDDRVGAALSQDIERLLDAVSDQIHLLGLLLLKNVILLNDLSYKQLYDLYIAGASIPISILEKKARNILNYNDLVHQVTKPSAELLTRADNDVVEDALYDTFELEPYGGYNLIPRVTAIIESRKIDPSKNDGEIIFYLARVDHWWAIELLLKDPRTDPSVRDNLIVQFVPVYERSGAGTISSVTRVLNDPRVLKKLTESDRALLEKKGFKI